MAVSVVDFSGSCVRPVRPSPQPLLKTRRTGSACGAGGDGADTGERTKKAEKERAREGGREGRREGGPTATAKQRCSTQAKKG